MFVVMADAKRLMAVRAAMPMWLSAKARYVTNSDGRCVVQGDTVTLAHLRPLLWGFAFEVDGEARYDIGRAKSLWHNTSEPVVMDRLIAACVDPQQHPWWQRNILADVDARIAKCEICGVRYTHGVACSAHARSVRIKILEEQAHEAQKELENAERSLERARERAMEAWDAMREAMNNA